MLFFFLVFLHHDGNHTELFSKEQAYHTEKGILDLPQISTIWKRSYKGGEWKPCISNSTGGNSFVTILTFDSLQ